MVRASPKLSRAISRSTSAYARHAIWIILSIAQHETSSVCVSLSWKHLLLCVSRYVSSSRSRQPFEVSDVVVLIRISVLSFRRSSLLVALTLFVAGCSFFSSQDTTPTRIINGPLDTSRSFARSVSLLGEFDRIGTINLATSFTWWDSTGAVRQLRENYGRVMAIYFWNDSQPWSVNTVKQLQQARLAMQDSDVFYLGVLTGKGKDSSAVWKSQRTCDSLGVDFQQVLGNNELNYAYGGINTMPTLFIVARNGKVHQTLEGQKTRKDFESAIKKTLEYEPIK